MAISELYSGQKTLPRTLEIMHTILLFCSCVSCPSGNYIDESQKKCVPCPESKSVSWTSLLNDNDNKLFIGHLIEP